MDNNNPQVKNSPPQARGCKFSATREFNEKMGEKLKNGKININLKCFTRDRPSHKQPNVNH